MFISNEHIKLVGETRRVRKLNEQWIGPFRVARVVNDNAYELELPASLRIHPVINVSKLKLHKDGVAEFPARPVPFGRPDPVATGDGDEKEFEVERILDRRQYGRYKIDQYLVRWKGYPDSEATWEPIEALDGALELIVEYNQKHPVAAGIPVAPQPVPVPVVQGPAEPCPANPSSRRPTRSTKLQVRANNIEDNIGFFKVWEDVIGSYVNSHKTAE